MPTPLIPAQERGRLRAKSLSDADLAAHLSEYADDIQVDTGRTYVPAFMREAARRLAAANRKATDQ